MSKSWDAFKNTTPQLLDGGMVVWRGLFTPKELDALERQCDALVLEEAKLNSYGVHPIRAVLIETTTEARARKLMELAEHPAVIGAGKRSALFWFCISPLFTAPTEAANDQHVATYLLRPEILLDRLWALPDLTMHGLGDAENS